MEKLEELLFQYFLFRMIEKYDADYTMRWLSNHCVLHGLNKDLIQHVVLLLFVEDRSLKNVRLDLIAQCLIMRIPKTRIFTMLELVGNERWVVYNVQRRPRRVSKVKITTEEYEAIKTLRMSLSHDGGFYDRCDLGR